MNVKRQGNTKTAPKADAPLKDWALWHYDHGEAIDGYWVTPLRPGEKRAYQENWSKAPLKNRTDVEQHWQANPEDNIGLVPRPGNFWLDADDLDLLEKAEDEHGRVPSTYTQRSINGSLHFLFQGEVTTSPTLYFDGKKLGEIRGALSGQCVAAGSCGTTREGEPGTWKIDELAPPTAAPDWVFDLIKGSGKATLKDARKDYGDPIPWDEEHAKRLIEAVELGKLIKDYSGPFLEGERDNLTFQLFAEAKNRMIHPDVMLEAIKSSGIDGGLEDDVERKMQSAYHEGNTQDTFGSKVPRYWLPNHLFKAYVNGKPVDRAPADPVEWKAANPGKLPKAFPSDPEPKTDVTDTTSELPSVMQAALGNDVGSFPVIPLYSLDELASFPEPEWDMEKLIGRAKMGMIVGKWGHYKTFIALDMGIALAIGIPWPAVADKGCKQYKVPKALRVLYVAAEGGAAEYNQRIGAALQIRKKTDRDQVNSNFVLATASAPLDTIAGQKAIADAIERATEMLGGPPEVIICDTLAKSMAGEENSNTEMGKVQRVAAAIQSALGCTFIFVHHTGKDGEKSGRGASSMPAGLDFLLHVTGEEATKVATVNVEKQKDAPAEKNIILQGRVVGNSLAFSRVEEKPSNPDDQTKDWHRQRLTEIIEEHGVQPLSTTQLVERLAPEAIPDFDTLKEEPQRKALERLRSKLRRDLFEPKHAKTVEAEDFRDRFRDGQGQNTKWRHKDAMGK